MAIGSLGLALIVYASGCAKHEAVKEMERLADEVCQCKDFPCAQDLAIKGKEKLDKWKDAKVSKSDEDDAKKAATRMKDCMDKLAAAASGAAGSAAGAVPSAPAEDPAAAPPAGGAPAGEPSANPSGK